MGTSARHWLSAVAAYASNARCPGERCLSLPSLGYSARHQHPGSLPIRSGAVLGVPRPFTSGCCLRVLSIFGSLLSRSSNARVQLPCLIGVCTPSPTPLRPTHSAGLPRQSQTRSRKEEVSTGCIDNGSLSHDSPPASGANQPTVPKGRTPKNGPKGVVCVATASTKFAATPPADELVNPATNQENKFCAALFAKHCTVLWQDSYASSARRPGANQQKYRKLVRLTSAYLKALMVTTCQQYI
ncbi:hypothetical protein FA95DRAFT_549686 [Auriscalpium vulgare]|uniref:Uncharacterized protein n=1 Tax=Auriscalpium vulgare TaxID=40419 RepID=A0ACB8S3F1_9AGAM|nr:hypothetical protein FA95DRAFT_549686 [Auriscalpium vulgare]